MLIDGQGNPISIAASALNIPGAPTNISTLVVSSINGSQYPPTQSDNFPVLSVGGGASASDGLITLSTISNAPGTGDFLIIANSFASNTGVQGAALRIQSQNTSNAARILFDNAGTQDNGLLVFNNVSTINGSQYPPVPAIQPLSTMTTFNGAQQTGGFQAGYVANFPYASTLLFPYPYPEDKVSVVVTPTNTGVPGGQQPSCALNAGFGINGVSSIGFSTDYRYNNVGQTSDFFWMAHPWTN